MRSLAPSTSRRSSLDQVATGGYISFVRAIGVKALKNKLSEYVRLAASGETVLVTDRDRVVAELGPPRAGTSPLLTDAFLAEAVRKGWLSPPLLRSDAPPPRVPVASARDVLAELTLDRQDR